MSVDVVSIRIRLHSAISNVTWRFGRGDKKADMKSDMGAFVNPYADDFPEIKKDLIESLILPKKSVSSTDWKQHWKDQFELEKQVIHSSAGTTVKAEQTKRITRFEMLLSDMTEILKDDVVFFAAWISMGKKRIHEEKLYDREINSDTILQARDSLKKD
jgi:hypothetical protein